MKISINFQYLIEKNFNRVLKYKSGDHIYSEGQDCSGVYYIVDGKVKILRSGLNKQMMMRFGEPKEFIGIIPFFDHSKFHNATAIATEPISRLIHISKDDFLELMDNHPEIQNEIIKELCEKIDLIEMRIINSTHQSLRMKLKDAIGFLIKQEYPNSTTQTNDDIIIHYSNEILAEISGISMKHLPKLLEDFVKNELVQIWGSHLIIDDFAKFASFK